MQKKAEKSTGRCPRNLFKVVKVPFPFQTRNDAEVHKEPHSTRTDNQVFHYRLVELGKKTTRRSPHDGKDDGMNQDWNNTRGPREEHGAICWNSQKNAWRQKREPYGGNNQVRQGHCEFENKIDDEPIQKGKDESMEENSGQESSAWREREEGLGSRERKEWLAQALSGLLCQSSLSNFQYYL
jgi:hypothetical protein